MIKKLIIKNFILVKEIEIDFKQGMRVLTGETGAGKSVVVGALDVLFGKPIKQDYLFDTDKIATIEAEFSIEDDNTALIKLINKYEIDTSEKEIFFRREIYPQKRNKTFLNGRRITRTIIKEFREVLLDFHSQRDQQIILNNDYQLLVLDKFGGLLDKKAHFTKSYREIRKLQRKLQNLEQKEKNNREKIKLYDYQIEEIENYEPKKGEDEKLENELQILSNAEEILNLANEFEHEIYETENSIFSKINFYISELDKYTDYDENINASREFLENAANSLQDAVSKAREIQNSIQLDENRLTRVKNRLDELNSLKNKYNKDLIGILKYKNEIMQKKQEFVSNENRIEKLSVKIDNQLDKLRLLADELTKERKKAAKKLSNKIVANVKKMAISAAKFKIRFDNIKPEKDFTNSLEKYTENGQDRIEFFFSANEGIELKPMESAVSGGELSRLLLVIKKIISENFKKKVIIFDEIDNGIGGKTAALVGKFISEISKRHQVICITHLAQIAAFADKHFLIQKKKEKNVAQIDVEELNFKKKKKEIARMLAGSLSDNALKHAEEIINR